MTWNISCNLRCRSLLLSIKNLLVKYIVISSAIDTLQSPSERRVTFPSSLPPLKKRSIGVIGGNDDIINEERSCLNGYSILYDKADIFIFPPCVYFLRRHWQKADGYIFVSIRGITKRFIFWCFHGHISYILDMKNNLDIIIKKLPGVNFLIKM